MDLASPVTSIPGVGQAMATKLNRLAINTVFDLLYHLPFRYEDRSHVININQAKIGDTVSFIGQIDSFKNGVTHSGKFIQTAILSDQTGSINLIWFNQPFLSKTLKKGTSLAVYGKVDFFSRKIAIISPDYELIKNPQSKDKNLLHIGRIIPVYPETAGLSSKWLRNTLSKLLPQSSTPDILPPAIVKKFQLPNWSTALQSIHNPSQITDLSAPADLKSFRDRLAFDELLITQLAAINRRHKWKSIQLSHALKIDSPSISNFISLLPFTLTASQEAAIGQVLHDLSLPQAMNRLLQGDVGSGKTVVAAIAAYAAHQNGFQTLFLAPTQILASQHHQTLSTVFRDFGVKVTLVTSTHKYSSSLVKEEDKGEVLVGTHALLNSQYSYSNVGLVVIDEQQRFGVIQRHLAAKKGSSPHILTMTATPIPRSVALTLYGDLELSILKDNPSGRLPIKTWIVPEIKRNNAYNWITSQITDHNSQVFIICPFIEPSESATSVKSAIAEFSRLKNIFSTLRLSLLHGRLNHQQKEQIINNFRAGEIDILVTTPIVEVGIDIPNANIIVIEDADRFGLSQLHQLRGRVGRGNHQAYCFLFSQKETKRIQAMTRHLTGFELAEVDLKLRGPGEIYGTAQHGFTQFHVASYSDTDLLIAAKTAAEKIFPDLPCYPTLRRLVNQDKIDLVQPN